MKSSLASAVVVVMVGTMVTSVSVPGCKHEGSQLIIFYINLLQTYILGKINFQAGPWDAGSRIWASVNA